MNWTRLGTVLAVLALAGLAVGAAATLLGGSVLATQSGLLVLGVVALVVAVLAVAGAVGASRVENPYW